MNLNIASDIEKKVDRVIISLPFNQLSIKNLLQNKIPTVNDFIVNGQAVDLRIRPGDGNFTPAQKITKSGIHWNIGFDFTMVDNTQTNFKTLNRFTNKKVALMIGTSTYIYWFGTTDQLLDFSFRETLRGFSVNVTGDIYFPAARKKIQSFRSSF